MEINKKITPKVIIINRASIVQGASLSRSVEERLFEPLIQLHKRGEIELIVSSEASIDAITGQFNFIILNRPHSQDSFLLAQKAKECGAKIIIDLDDLPIFFPENDSAYLNEQKKAHFLNTLELADLIVCSTARIQEWTSNNYAKISSLVIQTGLDFDKMDRLRPSGLGFNHNTIVFTNAGSLKLGTFSDDWLQIMKASLSSHQWKLGVFADSIKYFPTNFPLEYYGSVPWLEHKILLNKSFPLSVVPLASTEDSLHLLYSQYKTPIKYLINGGLGIPSIYSKSPIYEDVIENNVTGLLVNNNKEEWTAALELMINNVQLREKIASAAIQEVRDKFSLAKATESWRKIILH